MSPVPDSVVLCPSGPETLDHAAIVAVDADGAIVGRAVLCRLYGLRAEIRFELAPSPTVALALVDGLEREARARGLVRLELDALPLSDSLVAAVRRSRPVADEIRTSQLFLTWPMTPGELMTQTPHRIVVAGGGVAGLEALLALHALAGDRVALTLVSPTPDFVYRPLAVAEPFALGHQHRTPLAQAARDTGATFVQAALVSVDAEARTVRLGDGRELAYDALVLATGAGAEPAYDDVVTWDDTSGVEAVGGLLRDLEEGYSQGLAIVVPPGPGWPLPAYELALLIAGDARGMGMEPEITLVTPESAPLAIFGPRAVELMTIELERAGVNVELSSYADIEPGPPRAIVLRPSGRRLEVNRILALPRLRGRTPDGIPADPDGFVSVDAHGRVAGVAGVWAAGDGIDFPVKFGGLAAEQADAVAADIAADAGAVVERKPFHPVLRGRLLTGSGARYLRYDAAGGDGEGEATTHTLWWPPSKINGRYLTPWLAALDEDTISDQLPHSGGLAVQTDLHRSFIAS
jgi:sulfide:quinone oxidoreductase